MSQCETLLPKLRQELRLFEGPVTNKGEPCWLIYDPVRHRYFRITQQVFEVLSLWRGTDVAELKRAANKSLKRKLHDREITDLVKFLHTNNLTEDPASGDGKDYADQIAATKKSLWKTAIHSYLFFRIPLLRPDKFLKATMPAVEILYTRIALSIITLLSLVGIYLASRQWEEFKATFLDFLSLEGAAYYALSLVFVKTLHELGHAYTATRHGVRVNTMGVAFMVMMPLLFTDVTDAWRLKSRRKKLAIDSAGMGVELILAGLATFLWAFLPDGHLRSIAFVLATTSWILSLLVNLNPFMRFDGYYILADGWGIPNLQPRAFAMARWWLREKLFGLGHKPPEVFAQFTHSMLILYAIGTWIYRLILFLGIALLVYHFFFKALGIFLFVVEILWFIILPVWREFMEWWNMRQELVKTKRSRVTVAVLAGLTLLAFVPWSGTVAFQAVVAAERETQIFSLRPAYVRMTHIFDDRQIKKGDVMVELASPDLDFEVTQTERQIALLEARRARIAGDQKDRLYSNVISSELAAQRQKLAGLKREQDLLTIRAPFSGTIKDVDNDISAGQWLDHNTPIARVIAPGSLEAKGYVDENDIWRLEPSNSATFIPEDPMMARQTARLVEISKAGVHNLDVPYLSSVYGGEVASERNAYNEIVPRSGQYLVRLTLKEASWKRAVRGTIHLIGKPESYASAVWRRVLQVLVRESGI